MTTKEVEVKLKEYIILHIEINNLKIDLEGYEEYGQTGLYNKAKIRLADLEAKIKVLDDALSTLRPEDCELIRLRYFRRYDISYIADKLNISNSNVQKRKKRILEQLVEIF